MEDFRRRQPGRSRPGPLACFRSVRPARPPGASISPRSRLANLNFHHRGVKTNFCVGQLMGPGTSAALRKWFQATTRKVGRVTPCAPFVRLRPYHRPPCFGGWQGGLPHLLGLRRSLVRPHSSKRWTT
ncbi:hypothetical protein SBV1_1000023 [Verrucomicrobia bacterium]|nr:hypothetical protein SBV1_1000023 [Verrucomicrobiota bacterium]